MYIKKLIRTSFYIASVLICSTLIQADSNKEQLFINNSEQSIYIYAADNFNDMPIASLSSNGAGYVIENKGTVLKIESGNYSGYIKNTNLLIGNEAWKKAEQEFDKQARIKSNTVMVYEDKEMQGRVVDLVGKGDEISILEEDDETLEVMTLNNIDGFITSADAEVTPVFNYAEAVENEAFYDSDPDGLGTNSSDEEYDLWQGIEVSAVSGEAIVAYACQFVGNPYIWGEESLTEGTDCSGFVQSVYANFGISLPRTSKEQRSSGIEICKGWNEEKAIPGDLVCYDGHIAIYVGNGQIVHAANKRDGIKISRADYREVLCVRRILGSRQALYLTDQEKDILYRIVEAEAGGEDYKGKILVANVILNRVVDSNFPDSVEGVVFQKSASGTYQFSPIADGRYDEVTISKETIEAVNKAIKGIDPTQGSLYFMNPDIAQEKNVIWFNAALQYLFTYGGHAFYR